MNPVPPPLTPAQWLRHLSAQAFGVSEAEMFGPSRKRPISIARQATCYVLRRRFAHLSYPAIAKMMRRKDHSTIIFAVRQTEARMGRDADLARKIAGLIALPVPPRPQDAHVRAWAALKAARARANALAPIADDPDLAECVEAGKVVCAQCERAVTPAEAQRCRWRLCGLRWAA